MRIKVTGRSHTDYDDYSAGTGQWDHSWSTSKTSSIDEVSVIDDDEKVNYGSESFLIADGSETAYILWMTYGTGDSFGSGSGELDIIHAFGREDVAKAAFEAFKANSGEYSIKFKDDFDREVSVNNAAAGYFESLESLNLDPFSLTGTGGRQRWKP